MSIASSKMAKVEYADAIKTVSGALTKINKKSPHAADQKMVLATHRKAATQSKDCSRIYLRGLSSITRTTPLKPKEVAIRQRFQAVRAMVAARKEDLTKVTQDQIDFLAQRDLANGKKTMNAYLWLVCGREYDESQD